jgi:hypothetical protein
VPITRTLGTRRGIKDRMFIIRTLGTRRGIEDCMPITRTLYKSFCPKVGRNSYNKRLIAPTFPT